MIQVRAEATAAARRELDSQLKGVEKGREEIRALQDRLGQAQQDNTKQGHLLAVQAADLDQRAAKITKQEVGSQSCAARYYTGLLIKLTPKGIVFSFSFSFLGSQCCLTNISTLTYSTLSLWHV